MTTPTGVFVRLPLSEDQKQAMYDYVSGDVSMEEVFRAIGTPVAGGEPSCCGSVKWHYNDLEPVLETYSPDLFEKGVSVKVVRQSDHLAALASLQAEVGRLREVIHKMTSMSMNSGAWLSNDRIANCRDELSAMMRLGTKALKGPEA